MSPPHRLGLRATLLSLACGLLLAPLPAMRTADAQREGRTVPREIYFFALEPLYAGEYRSALDGFRSAARSGIRSTDGLWIDSVCYLSMIGECFYHTGDLEAALHNHEQALRLYVSHRNWMRRMQWPAAIQPGQSIQIAWGPSSRQIVPGQFPDTVLSMQGTDLERVRRQGGVVAPPELYPVRAMEILRCVAVSLRRRNEILGRTAPYQTFSAELVQQLSSVRGASGWVATMVNVHIGLAKAGVGKRDEAMATLGRSVLVNQRFDHPLTAIALLEMGKLALADDKLDVASRSFYEATFPAAQFSQPDVLEEAFTLAARTHLMLDGKTVFPPLEPAAVWTRSRGMQRAHAAILLAASRNAALLGQTREATALLSQSKRSMGRSELSRSDLGARWQFHSALVAIQNGQLRNGRSMLAAALKMRENSSPWTFQIKRTVAQHEAKEISPRLAGELYKRLLDEPTDQQWTLDPQETLQYCTTSHRAALENWLELTIDRSEFDVAVEVAERIRRQKFYENLPLSGRLLSLRWVLFCPDEFLGKRSRAQRKQIIEGHPEIADLGRRYFELEQELRALPGVASTPDHQRQYERVVGEISKVSAQLEDRLLELALRPQPAYRMFPPVRRVEQMQSSLKAGQAALILTFAPRNKAFAVLLTAGKQYEAWPLKGAARSRRSMGNLMQDIGNYNSNQVLKASRLSDDRWKEEAKKLYAPLAERLTPKVLESIDELIVVPDGHYWYLPFELLQVPTSGESQAMIELAKIRYLPMAPMIGWERRGPVTGGDSAIAVGRLFGRDSDQIIRQAARQLLELGPNGVPLRRPLPADSSILSIRWDRLTVFDDIDDLAKGAFAWGPAQIDRGAPGSTVEGWMKLPWAAPDQLILPGFHTPAEDGLRGKGTGDEMLLSTLGLMASGVRTMLLSRWRTGGQMSMDLVREFVQELPNEDAASAWQRSVLLARSSELDPTLEPRLKQVQEGHLPKAEQPFFWSGYMLIDTGSAPPAR